MDFYKQYPSGLKLVAKQLDHLYTVTVGVFIDVGSVKETIENNGYSHFIEHLTFKGTKRRSSLEISEVIDDIGASINAYTAKDNTCYYTKSAASDLETCIDLLSDMYFNASFPEDELERERGVVLEEIKMCEDTPDDVCQDLISQALFYGQPLGQTILGNPENIKYSDRHSIKEFKDKHYIPSSTVISVCGKFDYERLDTLIQNYFEVNCMTDIRLLESEANASYTSKFIHRFKSIEQSHLQIAWGAFPVNSPSTYANNMFASILGGGLTSRLYQSVREKNGLAYSIYAYPSYYKNAGTFEIYAGFSPKNYKKVCKLIDEELLKIVNEGISEKELLRAKTQAINSLYMSVENPMTLMRLYGRSCLKYGEQFNVDNEVKQYQSVTLKDMNEVSRQILTRSHALAYVGPQIEPVDLFSNLKSDK